MPHIRKTKTNNHPINRPNRNQTFIRIRDQIFCVCVVVLIYTPPPTPINTELAKPTNHQQQQQLYRTIKQISKNTIPHSIFQIVPLWSASKNRLSFNRRKFVKPRQLAGMYIHNNHNSNVLKITHYEYYDFHPDKSSWETNLCYLVPLLR